MPICLIVNTKIIILNSFRIRILIPYFPVGKIRKSSYQYIQVSMNTIAIGRYLLINTKYTLFLFSSYLFLSILFYYSLKINYIIIILFIQNLKLFSVNLNKTNKKLSC